MNCRGTVTQYSSRCRKSPSGCLYLLYLYRLCNSAVGRQKGPQYINLDSGCMVHFGTVLHEMLHTLGFYHMHQRPDRDNYITVYPQNANICKLCCLSLHAT